jgi:hypothetical protein
MSNLYREPSIDASYQVSVHLAEGFQRRRLKCEKLTDDRRRTTDAKWWQKLTLPLARWSNKNYIETRKDFWLPLKNYGEFGRNEKNSLCSGSDEPNFFEINERCLELMGRGILQAYYPPWSTNRLSVLKPEPSPSPQSIVSSLLFVHKVQRRNILLPFTFITHS